MKFIFFMLSMGWSCFLLAQPTHLMVPFQDNNGGNYAHALTGGMNNPQFSTIDLDGDGDKDLVYFDRQGSVVVPFLNGGTPNAISYTYAPEYIYRFPKLERWMLLRDYNCDGLEDIFAYKYDYNTGKVSITVYKTSRDSQNKVVFTLAKNIIEYHLKGQTQLFNLFNSTVDLPAVDDIDGDGDMDILNFNSGGGHIELFKNESQENGHGCDSLNYVYSDNCWGRMYESGVSEHITLVSTKDSCPNFPGWTPPSAGGGRHAGSTILTLDMDNDGDKEVILGDLSFTNLNLLTNGGTADTAHMVAQEMFFPQNSFPVNIDIFPAAFYVDINNDGAKDLLAAPNIRGNAVDTKNWYYKNTGTAQNPVFTYQNNTFLVNQMVDVGTSSAPAFVDYNGDGLLDIVVGNYYTFYSPANQESFLSLYENVGTANFPAFRLVNSDFATLKQYNQRRLVPTFGDLDNDGDQDMIVGLESGELFYIVNQGTTTNPSYPAITASYSGIDVGKNSVPQLVDMDRDGDLDLVVGEGNGNTNYFENTGTASAPTFSSTETSTTFGLIDTKLPFHTEGNAAPHIVDISGSYHLFMGSEIGEIWRYNNIDGNLTGAFNRVTDVLDMVDAGERSILAVADINNDGHLDFLAGNTRGGLTIYTNPVVSSVSTIAPKSMDMNVYPNPTTGVLQAVFATELDANVSVQVLNLLGQELLHKTVWVNQDLTVDLAELPVGSYLLKVVTEQGIITKKVIKK